MYIYIYIHTLIYREMFLYRVGPAEAVGEEGAYVCVCVCVYIYIYIYIYICIYVYIHRVNPRSGTVSGPRKQFAKE